MTQEFHGQSPGLEINTSKDVNELRSFLHERLKGQPKAINAVCDAFEYDLGLRTIEDDLGPIACFLYLGPSGVGKTELARLLSEFFIGNRKSLIKIPCETFSQPHTVHILIGSPHSYIGYGDPPMLSQAYIDQIIKPKKPTLAVKPQEASVLNREFDNLMNNCRAHQRGIEYLRNQVESLMNLIVFLKSYKEFMYGNNSENSSSISERIKDLGKIGKIIKLLPKNVLDVLQSDLYDPNAIEAMLIEFFISARLIVGAISKMEADLEKLNELAALKHKELDEKKMTRIPISDGVSKDSGRIVILFDEVEKSSQTIKNLLLEIMEDGKVTLANGQVTDLTNAVIILTSNIGAREIGEELKGHQFGFEGPAASKSTEHDDRRYDELEKKIWGIAKTGLEKTFTPEFIGRLDNVVVFRPLRHHDFLEILDLLIRKLKDGLARYLKVNIDVDPLVKDFIVRKSLDHPSLGARLLKNKFKSYITKPLGRILSGEQRPNYVGIRLQDEIIIFDPIYPTLA